MKRARRTNTGDTSASFTEAMAEAVHVKPVHLGKNFDEFLAEEGMLEAVKASSIQRVTAFQRQQETQAKGLTKTEVGPAYAYDTKRRDTTENSDHRP